MPGSNAGTRERVARWRYVVPNAITCIGLLIGLTSIFKSMEGDHLEAAWLIVLCVLLDKADGTAARLLRATSQIGMQLDSFSDFVTFGIAPGTLILTYVFSNPGDHYAVWQGGVTLWILRALIATYVLCSCIRLAKFNVLTEATGHLGYFFGMPTTFAGAFVAVGFIVCLNHELWDVLRWSPLICAFFGALKVSNLPIPKLAPRKNKFFNYFQISQIIVGYALALGRVLPEYLLALLLIYFIGGFGVGFSRREELHALRLDPYPDSA